MRRTHRLATRRSSRGDLTRVASMLMTLLVLGMLIRYAGDSENWRWVESLDSGGWAGADEPEKSEQPAATAQPAKPAPAEVAAAQPDDSSPLTDEDPEEADSAREEFQAVGDRTLFNQAEEMLAYNRLVKWTRHQSFDAMLKRAKRKVLFNDLVQSPDRWRGKLVALDLIACRVLKYDEKPDDNPLYDNLHEVWGFTTESRNWLYEAVVVDPPKQLPTGPSVWEKVRVVGYFFKLQAYQPAGAKPNQPPLFAPVILGRLVWTKPVIPRVQSADYLWAGMVAALFGLVMLAAVGTALVRRSRPSKAQTVGIGTSGLTTDEWLERAVAGEAPLDDDSAGDRPSAGQRWPDDSGPLPADPQNENPTRAP